MRRLMHLRTVVGKGGGPEKTILNSPRFLPDYDVRLVYIRPSVDPEYDLPERAKALGAELIDIPERSGLDPRTYFRLDREIRAFRPDLLHPHDYKTNLLAILLGRKYGIPVVTTAHGNVSRGGRLELYYRLDGWCFRRMRHVVVVSEDLQRYVRSHAVDESRITLIHNAIDTDMFRRSIPQDVAKQRLGFSGDRIIVGTIARLAPEKRLDLLIDAVGRLTAAGANMELVIAGDGPERSALEARIRRQSRPERFQLLGHRSDVIPLLEAMDVFALTSDREGLPNSLLEAMAVQVPVVATRVAGIPRLIQDRETGLLIDPGDAKALEHALSDLAGTPDLRRVLSDNARGLIERDFSFSHRMSRIRGVYDAVLGNAADSGRAE